MPRKKSKDITGSPKDILTEADPTVLKNALADLFGLQSGQGTAVNRTDPLFLNNRWALVSNLRQVLSQMYVEHGLVQTIVDVPVDDAFRGGIEIHSKQISPEEIEELQAAIEMEDLLNRVVGRGNKWKRLYGGAAIVVFDENKMDEPFSIDNISQGENLEFLAVDMWELFYSQVNIDPNTQGAEISYEFERLEKGFEYYDYYGKKLHKSRVQRLHGLVAPSFIRPRLRGWGFSVVEAVVSSMNQYFKSKNVSYEVLDEFKIDVYKLKNLTSTLMSSGGTQKARERTQLANQMKNYLNAIILDGDDDYLQKQVSFSGLADVQKEVRMQVASDLRMPLTKIFGISAAGFNSGEDDIEVYNGMIESTVRAQSKKEILLLLQIKCKQLFGSVPTDLRFSYKPLRVLSLEQEENVKTQQFNRVLAALQAGAITSKTFADSCNKGNLLPVHIDEADILELEETKEQEEEEKVEAVTPPSTSHLKKKVEKHIPKDPPNEPKKDA